MLVRDWMTTAPLAVEPDTPILAAWRLMEKHRARAVAVLKGGRLVGTVTDRDLRLVLPSPATSLAIHELGYVLDKMTVSEVMRKEGITATPQTPMRHAAYLLLRHRLDVLPVLEGGAPVGTVSDLDVLRAFVAAAGAVEMERSPAIRPPSADPEAEGAREPSPVGMGGRWARRLANLACGGARRWSSS